jgi:hypothetical protein
VVCRSFKSSGRHRLFALASKVPGLADQPNPRIRTHGTRPRGGRAAILIETPQYTANVIFLALINRSVSHFTSSQNISPRNPSQAEPHRILLQVGWYRATRNRQHSSKQLRTAWKQALQGRPPPIGDHVSVHRPCWCCCWCFRRRQFNDYLPAAAASVSRDDTAYSSISSSEPDAAAAVTTPTAQTCLSGLHSVPS